MRRVKTVCHCTNVLIYLALLLHLLNSVNGSRGTVTFSLASIFPAPTCLMRFATFVYERHLYQAIDTDVFVLYYIVDTDAMIIQ